MEKNSKYSDSVNAMNGCLLGGLRLLWQLFAAMLVLTIAPYVGVLFLMWWPVAWILGLLFPGREFFPARRIWEKMSGWVKRCTGFELETLLILSVVVLTAGAAVGLVVDLFRRCCLHKS